MLNQIKRLWTDNGSGDKDFSVEETKLKEALMAVRAAADQQSRAVTALLDLINGRA